MSKATEILDLEGHDVPITNGDKIFFPKLGLTKLDLVRYWLDVADGALAWARNRPTLLKRHPNGVEGDFFYQKRAPAHRPEWIETVMVQFPSGRSAGYLLMKDRAHLAWAINLGCLEIHTWGVRAPDTDHPDELRIDVDPTPEASWDDVRRVALIARDVLDDYGMVGYPKTSGKRGIHIYVRIEPSWDFYKLRRAALALAREAERRAPKLITTAWWKEERHGVFIDYNQNARDRTIASAYSVRPTQDGRVSAPITWDEVPDVEAEDLTLLTVPARFRQIGEPAADMDRRVHSLEPLLELAARDEKGGLGDAPWPPHFPKAEGEPPRVNPSRARKIAEWEATRKAERAKKPATRPRKKKS